MGREVVGVRSLTPFDGVVGLVTSRYLDLLYEGASSGALRMRAMKLAPVMPAHELWSTANHARCSPRCRRLVRLLLLCGARRTSTSRGASRFPLPAQFAALFTWLAVPRNDWLESGGASAPRGTGTVPPLVALAADESLPSTSAQAAALGIGANTATATTWHRQQRRMWLPQERCLVAGLGACGKCTVVPRLFFTVTF